MFFIKKKWAILGLQILTYAGALVWVHTAYLFVQQRIAYGESWVRLGIILLFVAAFTFFTGTLLNSAKIKSRYK